MKSTITALAHFSPDKVVPNSFFTLAPDSDYIKRKTGIDERRYFEAGATSDMLVPAIKACLQNRGIGIDDIDCLIVGTVTPDYQFPSTAAAALYKLNATKPWGFDLSAACAGFIYGLQLGSKLIESKAATRVLVCGADKMSTTVNFEDIKTSILFGDAAGVVLLEATEDELYAVTDIICKMDASGLHDIYIPGGGTAQPLTAENIATGPDKMVMNGRTVFEFGVTDMVAIAQNVLNKSNTRLSEIDYLLPHQSNLRMIEAVAEQLGISNEKVLINIERYGNTCAATIPVCLSEFYANGTIKKGNKILLTAIGSGFAYGGAIINWGI